MSAPAITEEIAEQMRENTRMDQFSTVAADYYDEAHRVLVRKHQDYGPKNIANSPGGPLNGLMVRLYDKLARLENLLATGADPTNESLSDTLLDIANYGMIGLMVLGGDWPGVE